ncbi:MAG TPA: hypothetical protein PLQ19_06190 [Aeromicrobium sp.]|nr:hypothetical protein [Aeromicrobium sp.]
MLGSATINGLQAAIHWDAQDEPSVLPAPTIADYTHTAATAGADDVVVGYASKFAANTSFGGAAIAWDDHGVVNLNERVVNLPADVTLQSAADINASGQIVGTADTADGSRGFVLTPVEEVEPEPVSTSISAPAVKQVYGLPTKLLVTLTSGATGKVTVTAGTKKVTGTLSNGQARVVLPAKSLAPGNRTVTISYPGVAGEFSPATASAKVQVSKAKTTVKAKSAKTKVKRGKVAVFKIAVSSPSVKPTGKIRVNFAGKTKTLQLKNSKATIKIKVAKATKPGAKTAKVTYLGDAFAGASNAKTVRVTITD